MDVLTEAIRAARTRTAIYGRLELTAPWGIRAEARANLALYAVVRGGAHLEAGTRRLVLAPGDLVFLRPGLAHTLKDHPRSRAASVEEVYAQRGGRCGGLVPYGGNGPPTTILSAGFSFESTESSPFLGYLPQVFHVPAEDGLVRWLESTLRLMASEMQVEEPGYELVASRLADVLFVHALRRLVNERPAEAGWLRAVGDPHLGAALQAMHAHPEQAWTVESLARVAAMSRSAFAAHFRAVLGTAPLAYLTRWRMHRASDLLGGSTRSVAEIAATVGYATESAFAKVFKRQLGATPGVYRRRLRTAERGTQPAETTRPVSRRRP
jgi:AraC-like DNA-binding protein